MTGLYDGTSSGYAYLQWNQALGNDSAMISYGRASATDNVIDQHKLRNLVDKSKHVPQLEVLFSDGYLGARVIRPQTHLCTGSSSSP